MSYNKPFAEEINTHELCDYGCNRIAMYRFRNGKRCCSKHQNSCPAKRKNFSESQDHKENARKSLETRTKLGITKTSQIKGGATRRENGHYERLAETMREHWEERPWNNMPKWRDFKGTGIMVQSNLEYKFLEDLEAENSLEWLSENVERGPSFRYHDPVSNVERLYISDFKIGNTIYEIKGSYTWNKHDSDLDLERINKAKLDQAKKECYNVVLVLDGKRIDI